MRITEIDNYKNYDNPTNTELDKEMKQADDMYWKKKAKELEFGGLPHPYSKPYHFVDPYKGIVTGQGPLAGMNIVNNNMPSKPEEWRRHGFRMARNGSYYINVQVLKSLVDSNFA